MYILILTIFLSVDDGYSGAGGASVDTSQYETLLQCEAIKHEFLNKMTVTHDDLTKGRGGWSNVVRRASCVKLY